MTKQGYPPVRNDEVAAAFRYLRNHPKYTGLMAPKKTLWVDWFLLLVIMEEVMERRTPKSKLAMLMGTVVREFIPDINKATRLLGEAYRDAGMEIFRRRKRWQRILRKKKAARTESEHPEDSPGQYRLT